MQINNPGDIANFIKWRRAQLKLSQEGLARKAGVSRSWLAEVESGKPTVELGKVLKCIRILGATLHAAVRGREESTSVIDQILDQHSESE